MASEQPLDPISEGSDWSDMPDDSPAATSSFQLQEEEKSGHFVPQDPAQSHQHEATPAAGMLPGFTGKKRKQNATRDSAHDTEQAATDPQPSMARKKSKHQDAASILNSSQGVSQRRKEFLKARRQRAKAKKNRKSALEAEVEAENAVIGQAAPEPAFGEQAQQPLKVPSALVTWTLIGHLFASAAHRTTSTIQKD